MKQKFMRGIPLCRSLAVCRSQWDVCASSQRLLIGDSETSATCTLWSRSNHDSASQGANAEVEKIHGSIVEVMKGKVIPSSSLFSSLLSSCSSSEDVKLALDAVARLRTTRAVQGQQQANFKMNFSQSVLDACLRAKDTGNALKTIWKHNIYGITPSIESANQILAYARAHQDIMLMQRTLKTMSLNSLPPTRATAEIALRICKDQGNERLLFSLAKKFYESKLRFSSDLLDICISTAANAGETKHALEVQEWRSKQELPHTNASAFALAKVHLLGRKPKEAAQLIHTHVKESEEKQMYLRVLVRAWSAEVLSRKKSSSSEANLKEDVETMLKELNALGSSVTVDITEFGTGKESLRRPLY